tara:strand:- start:10 stop:231 length:222 start_codon:yes stop_codon:yes gene_type:complete
MADVVAELPPLLHEYELNPDVADTETDVPQALEVSFKLMVGAVYVESVIVSLLEHTVFDTVTEYVPAAVAGYV